MRDQNAWLKLLALLLIGLAAGPEIGLAMEMTTLLEILGAVMFFVSFSTGARMLMADLAAAARNFVSPPFMSQLRLPLRLVYSGSRALFALAMGFPIGAYVLALAGGHLP